QRRRDGDGTPRQSLEAGVDPRARTRQQQRREDRSDRPADRARVRQQDERPAGGDDAPDGGDLAAPTGAPVRDQQAQRKQRRRQVDDHGRVTTMPTAAMKAPQTTNRLHGGTTGGQAMDNRSPTLRREPRSDFVSTFPPRLGEGRVGALSHQPASQSTTATSSDTTSAGQEPATLPMPNSVVEIVPPGTGRTVAAAGTTNGPITRIGNAAISSNAPAQAVPRSSRTERGTTARLSVAATARAMASPTGIIPNRSPRVLSARPPSHRPRKAMLPGIMARFSRVSPSAAEPDGT